MINQLLESIDDLEIVTNECAVDVLVSTSMCYDKMLTIMENANDDDISLYPIFREETSVVQEGVGEELGKMNEGKSLLNKIIWFLPRLIAAIFKTITASLSKSNKLTASIESASKQSGEKKSILSRIWGSDVGRAAVAVGAYVVYAKFIVPPLAEKIEYTAMEKYFEKKGKRAEFKRDYEKFKNETCDKKWYNSYIEKKEEESNLTDKGQRNDYAHLSYVVKELLPQTKKMYEYAKEFASDKENMHIITKIDKKIWYKHLERCIQDRELEIKEIKENLEKHSVDVSKIFGSSKVNDTITPTETKHVANKINSDARFTEMQKECFNLIDPSNAGKYPDNSIKSFIRQWKADNQDLLKLGLLHFDEKSGKIRSTVSLDDALRSYIDELKKFDTDITNYVGEYKRGIGTRNKTTYSDNQLVEKLSTRVNEFRDNISANVLSKLKTPQSQTTAEVEDIFKNIPVLIGTAKGGPKSIAGLVNEIVSGFESDAAGKARGKYLLTIYATKQTMAEKVESKLLNSLREPLKRFNDINQSLLQFAHSIISVMEKGVSMMAVVCREESTSGSINYNDFNNETDMRQNINESKKKVGEGVKVGEAANKKAENQRNRVEENNTNNRRKIGE